MDSDTNGEFIFDQPGLTAESIKTASKSLNCDIVPLAAEGHYLIRKKTDDPVEIKVSVCGNVDAGKSTLVGVLATGKLDDGRGSCRKACLTHKHEIETGRTATIGEQILGFDANGNYVNKSEQHKLTWPDIVHKSRKVVIFNDLAGHEKYLKTTVLGLAGNVPDYCLLLVGANMGVTNITKEHFALALSLRIPVIVVVTKVDLCPDNIKKQTLDEVLKLLKAKGVRRLASVVKNEKDVVNSVKSFNERLVPIFEVSSVTGDNLELLRMFFHLLPPRIQWSSMWNLPAEISIENSYYITGVGTVVGGTVISGIVKEGQTMMLGPDSLGNYKPVTIKSIHNKRIPVKEIKAGQSAGFALKKVKRSEIRHGTILLDPSAPQSACWTFEADIAVISNHTTTIKNNYQPVIQCLGTRQSAKIVHIEKKESLRNGDRAKVRFRYLHKPEFLKVGMRIVFREGYCKGMGIITALG